MKKIYEFVEKKLGLDKVAHDLAAAYILYTVALVFAKFDPGCTSWVYAFEGFVAAVLILILKEVFDFFNNRPFDVKDILSGLVGAVTTFFVVGLLL